MRRDGWNSKATRRIVLGLTVAAVARHSAHAQTAGPLRPMRMIVPTPAGAAPDIAARLLAEGLARRRSHPITVENRPGADGVLGAEAFTQARPGEALFFSFPGVVTTAALMQDRLPYDPAVDLVPIHATVTDFLGLFVASTMPAGSVADIVEHIRARPGALNWFGSPGGPYLVFRDFLRRAGGLDMAYVSYRGAPPALLDLAGGRIHAALVPLAPALPLAREGRIRLVVVTNRTRAVATPEVPTAIEAGVPSAGDRGFAWTLWVARHIGCGSRGTGCASTADAGRPRRRGTAAGRRHGAARAIHFGEIAAELGTIAARWAALAREFGAKPPG